MASSLPKRRRHIWPILSLWLALGDPPGRSSHGKVIEANAVDLLSNLGKEPSDPPSPNWLGRWASRAAIWESGL